MDARRLMKIYRALKTRFGSGMWWPHETPFEVMVGAILTQQTVWKNVDLAIENLKKKGFMDPGPLAEAPIKEVEKCLRPSGFYKQKSARVQNLARYVTDNYNGDIGSFFDRGVDHVRNELLSLPGIGPETADSMLLFAGNRAKFVVDAYTFRVFTRLGVDFEGRYDVAQDFFEKRLPEDAELYKNFHANIVELAKNYCKVRPLCRKCPINEYCTYPGKRI